MLNQAAHVFKRLLAHDFAFLAGVRYLNGVENAHSCHFVRHKVFCLPVAEVVDEQVVGNAREPGVEFAVGAIVAIAQGDNCLDKRLLKEVVCRIFLVDYVKDVVVKPILITFQQNIEGIVLPRNIKTDQLVVGQ